LLFCQLETISTPIQATLVIHGGSYTPNDVIRRMVLLGVAKPISGRTLMIAFSARVTLDTLARRRSKLAVRDFWGQARDEYLTR
jgi:fructose/tagatose bisphosphate aldolase